MRGWRSDIHCILISDTSLVSRKKNMSEVGKFSDTEAPLNICPSLENHGPWQGCKINSGMIAIYFNGNRFAHSSSDLADANAIFLTMENGVVWIIH